MFGEEVTPNHHKLAKEFVLLDNLYCNGHVSADGHPWSTMAYNTDYIARNWALTYSRRAGIDDDDDGDLANAPSGYLWDACARHGLTLPQLRRVRPARQPARRHVQDGRARAGPGRPHRAPTSASPKARASTVRDTDNVETFLKEFREFEKDGNLPRFIVMSLGEDHTDGHHARHVHARRPASPATTWRWAGWSRRSRTSKSWPETAIFVIEDDAQNGPDHVDAHRTVGLVISPYTKRKHPRQHAVQHREHDPHDGADPRPAAAEPVRRRGHARCSPRSPTRPT